ncbi:MAG: hypothetical protein H6658_16075 [Ardenticatenaceae bacterium]|nr:hypothetical protein [Ardenticatenaceae bacterium]
MFKKTITLALLMSTILLLLFTLAAAPATVAAGAIQPRFVHDMAGANPLPAGATVRVLCFNSNTPDTPPNHDLLVETDADGRSTTILPADCLYAAALHLRHEQPSGKADHGPAYWIYNTSWQPGSTTPVSTSGNIFINEEWELVLYNLVASLAWEPAPDSTYLRRLQFGLKQASAYLYDITDGQMAFGPVTLHTGGDYWNSADMQFLAANDYRPSAYVGGIVDKPTDYTSATGLQHHFTPAHILLGRGWDRFGDAADPTNNWATADAYRTLVHEWAHYALFLFDAYQGKEGQPTDCTDDSNQNPATDSSNASIMDWHYSSSELWHPDHLTPPVDGCDVTWQAVGHGLSDWETLGKWGTIQNLNSAFALAVPNGLPDPGNGPGLADFLFNRTPGHTLYLPQIAVGGEAAADPIEPTVGVQLTVPVAITDVMPSDVYVQREGFILRQGRVFGDPAAPQFPGDLDLLGVLPNDRLRVIVEQYETVDGADFPSGRYIYPAPNQIVPPIFEGQVATAVAQDWQMSLDATYYFTDTLLTGMRVQLTSLNYLPELALDPPVLQLCVPDTAVGCAAEWRLEMAAMGVGKWSGFFKPLAGQAELPLFSYVHVAAPGVGQLTRWVQVSGGVGPGHIFGDAPLADGAVAVNTAVAIDGERGCNHVIAMQAADHDALTTSLGYVTINPVTVVEGVIGTPLDLDIILPNQAGDCPPPAPGDGPLLNPVYVTMAYSQRDIDRLNIDDERQELYMLQFNRHLQIWQPIPVVEIDPNLNLVTGQVSRGGVTVLAWARVDG